MAKGPLITRSELQATTSTSKRVIKKQRKAETAYQQEEKKIASFYRKESKRINQSRKQGSANGKRRPNGTLFDEISYYCYPNVMCGFFSNRIYIERRN